MHQLEVPEALSSARLERHDRGSEQIRSNPIRTIEIVRGRSERDEDDTATDVDGHLAPIVDAADVLPGVLRPCLVAELTRPRHRMERPHQPAGQDVIRADVAGRRHITFTWCAA